MAHSLALRKLRYGFIFSLWWSMLIEIPTNGEKLELSGSILWKDEQGILYSVRKQENNQRNLDEVKEDMKKVLAFTGNKKVCMVIEAGARSTAPPKEEREFIAAGLESVVRALAIISSSPLSRMVANLFFSFKPPGYPVKMFTNLKDARAWIRQYC